MSSLITGTPIGNLETQEDIYLEGAPTLFIQDYRASPLKNPDSDGFYWNQSGTSTYAVYELGCLTAVNLTENLTVNDVLCDNVGVKASVQQRNYLELQFTIQSFFPLQTLRTVLKGGPVTENLTEHTQKFGFSAVNNAQYWMVYCPKVYDEDEGAYIWWHFHKCQYVNAFTINTPFGSPWQITGVVLRAFADTSKPAAQRFGMMGRYDYSMIT